MNPKIFKNSICTPFTTKFFCILNILIRINNISIIYTKKFSFKRVANRIFTDFVIQGAGEITLEKKDNEILIKCFGESKSLKIKSRQIDALIIKDELEAEFND